MSIYEWILEETISSEAERQVEAEVVDIDEQIDQRVTEQLEEAGEPRSDQADDSTT
ncbi:MULTISPECIES: hypothetical protein [Halobacterium]|uniref:Vng6198h n=3 Tax=Halobacterium salinarum TaxID=2242 RepID=Q9HHW3_HALSA|nr:MULTISPECIES: hypothetical protein [Halobacterium]AAG20863.1 Vng6198h [Halobacterium salinarum NRC-1]MBB6090627.1 hypothetical protein [Halobacterium salinarum]MCF2208009.1 hypothetical protein [Halobacterium salinarum]MCF2240821.1 hypothetical protein [Halobacterium salinarum]MDL0119980.1 hypothetical protein [Halobacterium salinarum]